jgi:prepilin-type N-terminal cleavage/methylation domain-containing protein
MLNKKIYLSNKGFTLIELLVVTTIIIILAAVGLVSFAGAGKGARDAKRKADLETVRQALVLRRSVVGSYFNAGNYAFVVNSLVSQNYLSQPTPQDPRYPTRQYYHTAIVVSGVGVGFCVCASMEDSNNSFVPIGCSGPAINPYCVKNP